MDGRTTAPRGDAAAIRGRSAAIQGMTNREIAEALFLSLRTIETHLTHAYQKLDIKARTQLADAMSGRKP